MIIRLATEEDIPQMKQIRLGIEHELIFHRLQMQAKGEAEFLVVEDRGELVSFVVLKFPGTSTPTEYPKLEDLVTRPDKRRRGYARALLVDCEKRIKQRGFHKIGLAADPDRADPGRQLYEQLGYQHDGGASYVDGVYDGVEDWAIDMEKEL
ncbi:MAG: GNAT family N-acetyltransferase [Caldilineaceae bacterium]